MLKYEIYEYLLHYSYKKIYQIDIANYFKCSKMHISKIIRELIQKNIVIKEHKNTLTIINPYLLSSKLAFETNREKPLFFQTPNFKDTLAVLNKTLYIITSKSAKQLLNKKTPKVITAYVIKNHISKILQNFNQVNSYSKANLVIYPAEPLKFLTNQKINDINIANNNQIVIDLMKDNKIDV